MIKGYEMLLKKDLADTIREIDLHITKFQKLRKELLKDLEELNR